MTQTQTAQKATPRPWGIDAEGFIIPVDDQGFDRGGGSIAEVTGDTMAEREANAELIVLAANSHEELLAVVKRMRDQRDVARSRLSLGKTYPLSDIDVAIANANAQGGGA